ncbi:MAG: bifunctional phosphopantothenoylcysteine decarboxylase/phosphopantothenate--cysteine ligase CoaBC [Firmicutes bacterium]|nr:bifunctional phosphopantothenoylcysteine decarboxylase/phosphopantothenate--cysteine ligase CoaBC [Bacillota bacterium]
MILNGKTIAVCVSGGIAAYKACELVSRLKKMGTDVHVVMTENACRFVAPLTFETLSGNRVFVDMFGKSRAAEVEHISLAKKADLFVIAPCTANAIGKIANGIADDFLTTVIMATVKPVLIAPAMNTNMLNSAAYQANEKTLKERRFLFVEGECGLLACGDVGRGRLAPVETIMEKIVEILYPKRDFTGKRVVVTAGSTREDIDPVRFITNRSSGKMGVAIAEAAAARGASVTLIAGFISVAMSGLYDVVNVRTTEEMFDAVMQNREADYIIMAAAPCDYKLSAPSSQKIKQENLTLQFKKNPDIATAVGKNKGATKLVIFAAETENLIENAQKKLKIKNADMVVANDVTKEGAGFDCDTNIVTIITNKETMQVPLTTKKELAEIILDKMQVMDKA